MFITDNIFDLKTGKPFQHKKGIWKHDVKKGITLEKGFYALRDQY